MKKKIKRPIEEILEDILLELKIKNSQQFLPLLPPYQIITTNQIPPVHYHGSGIPCYNNPCVWC